MSAPKFTPGPWRVRGLTKYMNQVAIDPAIGCAYGAGEQVAANAALIAATPDLYAALEALEAYTDEYGPKISPGFSQDYEHARKLYAQARAALAKARGEG